MVLSGAEAMGIRSALLSSGFSQGSLISIYRKVSQSRRLCFYETVVLPGVYPDCSSVDLLKEYLTCQIRDLSDEKNLLCFCREESTRKESRRVISCNDGSIQKTCTKISAAYKYPCACQSAPEALDQGAEQFHWSSD